MRKIDQRNITRTFVILLRTFGVIILEKKKKATGKKVKNVFIF